MKARIITVACVGALFTGCGSSSPNDILSQQFIHKYGLDLSEKEWEERAKDGQVVTLLKDGVRISRSYEGGQLHGPTTYTFPHSSVVEKQLIYDHGVLLKEILHDARGIPLREEMYEFDNRMVITLWNELGAPLSIEKYEDELLVEGIYYTPEHELEGKVEAGNGDRVRRDRSGLLLCKDKIVNGSIETRTSYHPNGKIHTVSNYSDHQLHGPQFKYTASGKPLMTLHWNYGVLEGSKLVYRNGIKVSEIPYVNGQKHGSELHFDDLGTLTAEIHWKNDRKHGASRFYTDDTSITEWYYKGQLVEEEKYANMEQHDAFIAELDLTLKLTE